jgi:hypothetical protein
MNFDDFVKSPDAALRCILRHCGVRQVRLIPQDLRALPAELFTKPSKWAHFSTFYEVVNFALTKRFMICVSRETKGKK